MLNITKNWNKSFVPEMLDSNILGLGGTGTGKSFEIARNYLNHAISSGYPCFLYTENDVNYHEDSIRLATKNGYEIIICKLNDKQTLDHFSEKKLMDYRSRKVLLILTSCNVSVMQQTSQQIGLAAELVLFERVFSTWGKAAGECGHGTLKPARIILDGVVNSKIMFCHLPPEESETKLCVLMQPWLIYESASACEKLIANYLYEDDPDEEALQQQFADEIQSVEKIREFFAHFDIFLSTGVFISTGLHFRFLFMTLFHAWCEEADEEELSEAVGDGPWTWLSEPYIIERD